MESEPLLPGAVASCLSACAVTSVASRSITTRPSWIGVPAMLQTPFPRRRAPHDDRGQGVIDVAGRPCDQPRHRRVRGDSPEHAGLGAQHPDIAGGVLAQRHRYRQIGHDLARVVNREWAAPPPQQPPQRPGQAAAPRGLHQRHATRVRHQGLAAGDHRQPERARLGVELRIRT